MVKAFNLYPTAVAVAGPQASGFGTGPSQTCWFLVGNPGMEKNTETAIGLRASGLGFSA